MTILWFALFRTSTRRALRASNGPHCNYNPRNNVRKGLLDGDICPGERPRRFAWLDEVHLDPTFTRRQYAGGDLDNPSEKCRITNHADASRGVPRVVPKVLGARDGARQWLAALRNHYAVVALHVKGAVEVVTRVRIPLFETERQKDERFARQHDEELAIGGTLNPQRQPEVGTLLDCHCVSMFARDRPFH